MMKQLIIFIFFFSTPAIAQKSAVFHIDSLNTEGVLLNKGWKYQTGDNPDWAKSDFDDSAWTPIDPTKDIAALPEIFNAKIKWLRLDFEVKNKLPNPLGIAINQAGASEIYLNGQLIHQFGHFDTDSTKVKAYDPLEIPIHFPADSVGQYHLAVRYALQPNIRYTNIYILTMNRLFNATILKLVPTLNAQRDFRVYYIGSEIFKFGVFFMLFVLHLAFYFYQKSNKTHLVLAICFLAYTVLYIFKTIGQNQFSVEYRYFNLNISNWSLGIATICTIHFFYRMAKVRLDIYYYALVICVLVSMFVISFTYGDFLLQPILLLIGITLNLILWVRLTRIGLKKEVKGFRILSVTLIMYYFGVFCLMTAILALNFGLSPFGYKTLNYGISPYLIDAVFNLGAVALAIGLSLFMGIEGGEINKALSKQLVENDQLKNEAIEHAQEKQEILATQNVKLQQEVALQTKELRQLDGFKTRLYTNITHEFRTPLTVIMGMVDNIRGFATERELIKRNSKNLLRLINQMLDLSKLDSGTLKTHAIQGDIIPYLQYLTESFYSMAKDKNIRLVFYPETEAVVMDFDDTQIQHIVYNLLSNALKFTDEGGKVILHAVQIEQVGQPFLTLHVQDTGVGIPAEEMPFIFDRFYQADSSNTHKSGGTGIGLALTKELIEWMHGTIKVESTVGKGTSFTLLLPIKRECSLENEVIHPENRLKIAEIPENTEGTSDALISENEDEKPMLLIIEDNADVVFYMQSILQTSYDIRVAKNGKVGVEMAFELIPDIIISDVMMPEKDGYEVCHILKTDERTSHIPIILLTAKSTLDDKITGLKVGADAYLMKPFNKEELLVRLEKLLELRRVLQEKNAAFSLKTGLKTSARFETSPTLDASTVNTSTESTPSVFLLNDKRMPNLEKTTPTLDDIFLQKILKVIEDNLDDTELGIVQLGRAVFLGHTQLFRKMKAITGVSPTLYIRKIRLQKAVVLLRTTDKTIAEIAYDTGFSDPNYFSRVFSDEFKVSPSSLRK
jgi:signal transduction histidine kinase/DNA-binding response OmpR family regulator